MMRRRTLAAWSTSSTDNANNWVFFSNVLSRRLIDVVVRSLQKIDENDDCYKKNHLWRIADFWFYFCICYLQVVRALNSFHNFKFNLAEWWFSVKLMAFDQLSQTWVNCLSAYQLWKHQTSLSSRQRINWTMTTEKSQYWSNSKLRWLTSQLVCIYLNFI